MSIQQTEHPRFSLGCAFARGWICVAIVWAIWCAPHAEAEAMEHFWIDPPAGDIAGGDVVKVHLVTTRDIRNATVWFGNAEADVEHRDVDAQTITVKTPGHGKAPPRGSDFVFQRVRIEFKDGQAIEQIRPFAYLVTAPGRGWDGHPTAAIITVGLLLASQLFWSFKRLERFGRARVESAPPDPTPGTAVGEEDLEAINRLLDDHRRALDQLQSSLTSALNEMPQRLAKVIPSPPGISPPAGAPTAVEPQQNLSPRVAQTAPRPKPEEAPRPLAAKGSSKKISADAGRFGAKCLADMWNEARRSGGTTPQLITSLNAAWGSKVAARATHGLVIVTSSDENSSWVLPSLQPLVHEATIQEFFEVHAPRDGSTPRLVRPANVPRGTDPHGFTAGQIVRGVLEA